MSKRDMASVWVMEMRSRRDPDSDWEPCGEDTGLFDSRARAEQHMRGLEERLGPQVMERGVELRIAEYVRRGVDV